MTLANRPCADQARLEIFEGLSSYFLREEETEIGVCALCGQAGVSVVNIDKAGKGTCAAQSALTQKRNTVEEGHPLAFESPIKTGRFSMTDKFVGILVTAHGASFTGKVAPTRPLPPTVEADASLTFADLLDRVMQDPPDSFYIALFNQKADIAFSRSDADEFFINGTQAPIRIDRMRLLQLVALIEEFSYRAVATARDLKESPPPGKEKSMRDWMAKNAAGLLTRLREAPHGTEPEFEFAGRIVNNRTRHQQNTDL